MSTDSAFVVPGRESSRMVHYLLGAAGAGGADVRRIAKEAGIPGWVLYRDEAMVSPLYALRLWELAEHSLEDPHLPLTFAAHFQTCQLDLYDYLFTTAPTLRAGFEISARYLHLLTTNGRLQIASEDDRETTYSYRYLLAEGRGADLALQLSVAVFCARARAGTGQRIVPVRIGFKQRAPRSHRAFSEAFGTSTVDFDAPVTTFTFRTRDLDLPMLAADPVLARLLARYAATLPPAPDACWHQHFRLQLVEALADGPLSLGALARRMTISPRTLQRRLAERGTTWRAELDAARRWRADQLGPGHPAGLAHHLGYTHPRSASRAVRRWADQPRGPRARGSLTPTRTHRRLPWHPRVPDATVRSGGMTQPEPLAALPAHEIDVLVFDVLGTLVDEPAGIRAGIRDLAPSLTDPAVEELVRVWQRHIEDAQHRILDGSRPYAASDVLDREAAQLVAGTAGCDDPAAVATLARAARRLPAWPDTVAGLARLAGRFPLIGLSNASRTALLGLNAHAGLRWHQALSAEDARTYKPAPSVYALAVTVAAVPPERLLMVAAHAWDLRGAQRLGLRTAYVARPVGDPPTVSDRFDLHAEGLADLAGQLGVPAG